jgi:lipopolysaccharide/colanic/teichoic acid biosynthesis glycosyltransferase
MAWSGTGHGLQAEALNQVHGLTLVAALGAQHQPSAYEQWVKPAIDRLVGALLIVALSPVLLMVAIAVGCSLGSPVLLRQERVGQHGQVIGVYKFRSMHPCRRSGVDRRGPSRTDPSDRRILHKHPDDPRLTPLGRLLRSWSLDELPQLFNVLRGELSLVGPRPEMVSIVRQYEPWQHARHQVRPGMTGLWQVSARGDGLMHERTDVDLDYIKGLSFLTDCKLLLLTVPCVLGLRRGY